jgi:hypothetical protein
MARARDMVVQGEDHAFDRPDITAKEFLNAIMRDRTLPISVRMEAAAKVAVYEHPRLAQVNQETNAGITIRIEGGLPNLPGTNIIMPGGEPIGEPLDQAVEEATTPNGLDPEG